MSRVRPTAKTYTALDTAYDFFNARLFVGRLPPCLITMQRSKKVYGYFAGGRFGARDGGNVTDEIALNPSFFRERTTEQSLSTLVHEMAHLEQHHFGKPFRSSYHNKEGAQMMRRVGLIPSDTGAPGGREVGQKVSHYIADGGPFARACADLLGQGFEALYVELWSDGQEKARKKKAASKTRYTCPGCAAHAWGEARQALRLRGLRRADGSRGGRGKHLKFARPLGPGIHRPGGGDRAVKIESGI